MERTSRRSVLNAARIRGFAHNEFGSFDEFTGNGVEVMLATDRGWEAKESTSGKWNRVAEGGTLTSLWYFFTKHPLVIPVVNY